MKSHAKPFVVRGFDVAAGQFTSFGEMANQPTFVEKVVDKQHDAVAAMLTGPIGTMAPVNVSVASPNVTQLSTGSTSEVAVVDIKLVTKASNAGELRSYRSEIREILKRWAEKCRVAGLRGWRANALKTPTFEYDSDRGAVVIKTQAVLGNAVLYNDKRATVGSMDFQQVNADLRNLRQHVEDCLGGQFDTLYYNHSVVGKGEVL